jgi:hypothetical protein
MKKVHVFTSSALNYLPKARALFYSLREQHPEFCLHLALADEDRGLVDVEGEPFDSVIPVSSLDIPFSRGWAFCHNLVELSTAIKPFVLRKLLQQENCSKVLYFDPDIVVFSRLDDILESLDTMNIILTPHQITPESSLEAVIDNEICCLRNGVYNLGFIGVRASGEGQRFAEWWSERLYHFCRVEISQGLFTDQRWIDLVPALFTDVGIIKSPRHNVATWNLTTRRLMGSVADGFRVDGQPLGFYHFTGLDKGDHEYMATKVMGNNESVRALIKWYINETSASVKDRLTQTKWAFGYFSTGEPISQAQRLVYRERSDLQSMFKDPFDNSTETSYLKWWQKKGRLEYPGLFNPKTVESSIEQLRRFLTPGFLTNPESYDWGAALQHLTVGLSSPRYGAALTKRVLNVIRHEGMKGLLSRFKKY